MSQRAYRLACRDVLQNLFNLDADSCQVQFDGQPQPNCGEQFISVHGGSWTGISGDHDLDERFSVLVTVTRRLGEVPTDRTGIALLDLANTGLEATCREIVGAIHFQYAVMNAANSVYIADPFAKFEEPLLFVDGGHSDPKGPEWFNAENFVSATGQKWANAGVAQTLTFGQARRTQQIFPLITISPPTLPLTLAMGLPCPLPSGTHGTPYSQVLTATGGNDEGTDTYTFAIFVDPNRTGLPAGLSLSGGGTISGTPTTAGAYTFRVQVTDAIGLTGCQNYSLVIA